MANLTYLTYCASVYYVYGGDLSETISQVIAISSLLITLFNFIGLACQSASYRRFRMSFKRKTLAFRHYFFHIAVIVLSILFVCLLPSLVWLPLIPQCFMVVFTLVSKPYKRFSENIRSAYNYLLMMIITSMLLFYFLASSENKANIIGHIYPLAVEILLMIGIIWAYV